MAAEALEAIYDGGLDIDALATMYQTKFTHLDRSLDCDALRKIARPLGRPVLANDDMVREQPHRDVRGQWLENSSLGYIDHRHTDGLDGRVQGSSETGTPRG